jgi:putative membrane protein
MVLLAVGYVILRPPAWPADGETAQGRPGGRVQTRFGPLESTDRDLLVKVRQAGLWEAPTGQQAQQRGRSPKVKEVGAHLALEHAELDADVRKVAGELGVVLPTRPTGQQEAWMAELSALRGDAYDRRFVHRLRVAHGKVFAIIAQVRASTGNSVIRAFAERGLEIVARHMQYLESTGLVDFPRLYRDIH